MKNNKLTFSFFLIVIICISATSLYFINKDSPTSMGIIEPKFSEADQYTKSLGYNLICDTENAFYRIKDSSVSNKEDIVKRFETMFIIAKREYGMNFDKPIIYFTSNPLESNYTWKSFTVCPSDIYSSGVAFYYASGGKLPAWICSGLKDYWLNRYGFTIPREKLSVSKVMENIESYKSKNLPPFSDAWFFSNFNEGTDINFLCNASYSFISYIAKNKELSMLIQLGLTNQKAFIDKSRELMSSYAKGMWESQLSVAVHYNYDKNIIVSTSQAKYIYTPTNSWTWDNISKYTFDMDNAIIFVKNFIGNEYEEQLNTTLEGPISWGSYTSYSTNKITLRGVGEYGPLSCAHETVHALCNLSGLEKNTSIFLKEGLASLASYLYDIEYKGLEYQIREKEMNKALLNPNKITDNNLKIRMKIYEQLMIKAGKQRNIFDFGITIDSGAIFEFRTGERISKIAGGDHDKRIGIIIDDEMYSYSKVMSFFKYLYNNYGKEKILRAYYDNTKIEEIFGKPLQTLIDEWKVYIEV